LLNKSEGSEGTGVLLHYLLLALCYEAAPPSPCFTAPEFIRLRKMLLTQMLKNVRIET